MKCSGILEHRGNQAALEVKPSVGDVCENCSKNLYKDHVIHNTAAISFAFFSYFGFIPSHALIHLIRVVNLPLCSTQASFHSVHLKKTSQVFSIQSPSDMLLVAILHLPCCLVRCLCVLKYCCLHISKL